MPTRSRILLPETPESKEFRRIIDSWCRAEGVSIRAVMRHVTESGKPAHWARERYYRGVAATAQDVLFLKKFYYEGAPNAEVLKNSMDEVKMLRQSIRNMCQSCVGYVADPDKALCWDARCALRPVSPFPLSKNAKTLPPKHDLD